MKGTDAELAYFVKSQETDDFSSWWVEQAEI